MTVGNDDEQTSPADRQDLDVQVDTFYQAVEQHVGSSWQLLTAEASIPDNTSRDLTQ